MKKTLRHSIAILLAALMIFGGAPLAGIAGIEWHWPDFGWFDLEAGALECAPIKTVEYGGHVYALYNDLMSWDKAREKCVEIGGHLAVITSAEEQTAVATILSSGSRTAYWLGGSDIQTEGTFKWSTGEAFSYTNWDVTQPDNYNGVENVMEILSFGKWNDKPIDNSTRCGFICEFEDFYIPFKTVEQNGHIYSIYNEKLTWTAAKAACEAMGGHLMTITSQAEQDLAAGLIGNGVRPFYWLGASDTVTEGTFQWVTGEAFTYTNWRANQPDNWNDEDYLHIYNNAEYFSQWNDYPNDAANIGFICEIETGPYSPAATTQFNGSTYELYTQKLPFTAAKVYAEKQGGHLVTVTSAEENQTVLSLINQGPGNISYWLGAVDSSRDRVFKWVTGEVFAYQNWYTNEPNYDSYREFYIEMRPPFNYIWNDVQHRGTLGGGNGFIIEKETGSTTGNNVAIYDPNGGEYMGSSGTFTERQTYTGRYIRLYSSGSRLPADTYSETLVIDSTRKTHGSTTNAGNHYTEISVRTGTTNLMRNPSILPKSSIIGGNSGSYDRASAKKQASCWTGGMIGSGLNTYIGEWGSKEMPGYSYINDGNATIISNYTEAHASYITVDLGSIKDISDISIWRYYGDGRGYFDCVIVISDDTIFDNNDYILWNSDRNETWWSSDTGSFVNEIFYPIGDNFYYDFGAGKDPFYFETSAGKQIFVGPKNGQRYVVGNYNDPPVREGYTFAGWQLNGGQVYAQNDLITNWNSATGSDTFVAQWIPHQYTLAYDANGGTGAPQQQIKVQDVDTFLTQEIPEKPNHIVFNANGGDAVDPPGKDVMCIFNGWNTERNGNGTNYQPGGVFTLNGNRTLYAKWGDPPAGTLPTAARTGYTFIGWYTQAQGGTQVTETTPVSDGMELYAHWAFNHHVTYDANGGAGAPEGQVKAEQIPLTLTAAIPAQAKVYHLSYNPNGGNPLIPAVKTVACAFDRWNTAPDGSGTAYTPGGTFTANASTILYAQWNNPLAGSLPMPFKTGCTFEGWYTQSEGGTQVTSETILSGDTEIFARWRPRYSTSVQLATPAAKTQYFVGDTLQTDGISLQAAFDNGENDILTSGFVCSPMTMRRAGIQPITVTFEGKTVTFNVTVQAVQLTGITVLTPPLKTQYNRNETFSSAGLTLTATYNNGSTKTITAGFSTAYDFGSAGAKEVLISYTEGGVTVQTALTVTVAVNNIVGGDPVTANAGAAVSIPVKITGNQGMMGFSLNVGYDAAVFTPVSVSAGTMLAGGMLNDSIATAQPGQFKVVWTGSQDATGDGILFTVVFNVSANAIGAKNIALSYNQADTFNENWDDVVLHCGDIAVTVNNPNYVPPPALGASPATVTAGGNAALPVSIANSAGMSRFKIYLTYDPAIYTFVSVSKGPALLTGNISSDASNGVLTVTWTGTSTDGTLFTPVFATAEYKQGRHDIALSYDPANTAFATSGTVMACSAIEVTLINPFAGQAAWVQADHIQGAAGTTVNVPVRIFNNQGLMGFGITVHYDPAALTPLSVTRGTVTSAGMFDSTLGPGSNGSFKVIWNNTENVGANGALMVVSFTVNPGAALGDTPLTLTYTQADTFNEAWQDVTLDCRAAALTVADTPLLLTAKAGSATVIDRGNGLLYGLAPGLSVNDLLAQYLEAAPPQASIVVNGSVGTGAKVELIDTASGATLDSLTVVVFGDVNGDGNIDSSDAGIIVDYENFMIEFGPAEYAVFSAASDLNKDGNVDSSDAGIIVDVENYLLTVDQTTGQFLTL